MKELKKLGDYDWVFESDSGQVVRLWITETTDNLKESQRALVRSFKIYCRASDAEGEKLEPGEENVQPGFHADVLTVNRDALAQGLITLEGEIANAMEAKIRKSAALVVTEKALSNVPTDKGKRHGREG